VIGLFQNRLARFKHPRDVIFLDGPLPRTSLGKVQKYELRQRLGV
jgi:fatty-acyl-CoA synthase